LVIGYLFKVFLVLELLTSTLSQRLFEKYEMKPIIYKNLTPLPPSLQGNGDFKVSPVLRVIPFPSPCRRGLGRGRGEVWRGVYLYIKNF
jgi:hypothetical protein